MLANSALTEWYVTSKGREGLKGEIEEDWMFWALGIDFG